MEIYRYLFYQLYCYAKFAREVNGYFARRDFDYSAFGMITGFQILVLVFGSFKLYYVIFGNIYLPKKEWHIILFMCLFCFPFIFNYYIFFHQNKWKKIVKRFDRLCAKTKKKLNIQLSIWLVIVFSSVFSFFYFL
ncbi:MAG: hypothetical protein KGV44_04730 [Flavobacteriaceae bacterium]|nr:hypothetical protein [Flavobacteriaceae bacterium]